VGNPNWVCGLDLAAAVHIVAETMTQPNSILAEHHHYKTLYTIYFLNKSCIMCVELDSVNGSKAQNAQ
jgi:hypothetical protein